MPCLKDGIDSLMAFQQEVDRNGHRCSCWIYSVPQLGQSPSVPKQNHPSLKSRIICSVTRVKGVQQGRHWKSGTDPDARTSPDVRATGMGFKEGNDFRFKAQDAYGTPKDLI